MTARRGISLGEALISLGLLLVVLTVVGMVCRDASRVTNFAAVKEEAAAVELRLAEVAHECAEACVWQSPAPASSADVSEVRFQKVDPEQNHDPPGATDRLPLPLPSPLPASPWNGFDPSVMMTVRYFYDSASGQLMREALPARQRAAVVALKPGFAARFLPDGRLRLTYMYDVGSGVVQRAQEAYLPLR